MLKRHKQVISKRRVTKSKPRHSFTVPSFLAMPVILKLEVQDCAYAGSRGRAGPDVLLDGAVESVVRGQEMCREEMCGCCHPVASWMDVCGVQPRAVV